jgi:hypothetical protein
MENPEVKVAIIRSGKKAYEIAMELGWDRTKLSSIISGYYTPGSVEKQQLAQVLGRSVRELFANNSREGVHV